MRNIMLCLLLLCSYAFVFSCQPIQEDLTDSTSGNADGTTTEIIDDSGPDSSRPSNTEKVNHSDSEQLDDQNGDELNTDADLPDNIQIEALADTKKEAIQPWTGLQIVLFTPSDVAPPPSYRIRMKEVVDYTEAFFSKWMKHWGYPVDHPMKFHRDKEGFPIVWEVRGDKTQASGAYSQLGYAKTEVIPKAQKKYGIPTANQFWWIFSYPGPDSRAYRGSGSHKLGIGNANFVVVSGTLQVSDHLTEGVAEAFLLKATIHEMVHGLGLPHLGPMESDNLGNSLMGPTNKGYKKQFPLEKRVYLTKTAAAWLWKHPLMAGTFNDIQKTPTVKVSNLSTTYDSKLSKIVVSGKLISDLKAHSVVVINTSKNDPSEYWAKSFVGKVDNSGNFVCDVKELAKAGGELKILFCFENGAIMGKNGPVFGLRSALKKQYNYSNGTYSFK